MALRVYRAPVEYWLLSTIVVVALLLIPVVVIGGIPGFPHFAEAVAKWQRIYATRPFRMLTLALVWAATVFVFSYLAIKALLRLLSPRSLRGILEQVDATEAATKRTGWIMVSGMKHSLRYEKGVFDLLDKQRTANATVDIRVGVGDRVVLVDVVKSP
jgi:hypothetical protein